MSLLDRTIACSGIPEHRPHAHVLGFRQSSINPRRRCYAKVKPDDDEKESQAPHRGFPIRVPTIPKLGDIESARRLLESAFQALSFDMPKMPDSALQGFSFGIPKLSIPMRVLVLDITGFVVTKLRKPQKKVLEDLLLDDNQYPRCAWPRVVKGGTLVEVENIELLTGTQIPEASNQIPVGPHCAWPRAARGFTEASEFPATCSVVSDVLYPHSAWPRKGIPANSVVVAYQQLVADSKSFLPAEEKEFTTSGIEAGPRCAWPRKVISAKQNYHAMESVDNAQNQNVMQQANGVSGAQNLPAESNEAAELPRRMLATSVGLTVMNQLLKGSIVPAVFDLCSLLPAGTLEIPVEENAAVDIGRRTLLVFIKGSGD